MTEQYCFGRFTLDAGERKLFAGGVPVPLGPTDFRVLLALVEGAGDIVTKHDLMSLVGGRAANDNVLHVHINALRKTLGNDCIVNQQGRGYRFAVPVRRSEHGIPRAEHRPGNLPSLWTADAAGGPTRLIGRSEQLRFVSDLFPRARLITLTGPGGVGKTRLALRAANEAWSHFGDGVWFVELASLNDPDLVPGSIASALGVKIGANATPVDSLSRYLARKSLLIVLDNCEQVIAACARTSETLLGAAPGLKILATSREPLSSGGEQVLEVPSLTVPDENTTSPNAMRNIAAIELFMQRSLDADANFRIEDAELAIVARICRRVDGLPLAIEMVAGWAGLLGLETLEAKLDGSLKSWLHARSTAPLRHSTLRATLEWSHALLSPAEQAVLSRLSVFQGGFTMEAAEAVAADDIPNEQIFERVASLIRKSMIALVPGSRVQAYRLLETTRAFMLEKLTASGDADAIRQRHAHYVLGVLETAVREWEITSDAVWLERYRPVLDDLRAALDWAMGQPSDDGVALAGASWPLWRELSLRAEGRQRLSPAADRLRPDTPPALEARLRRGLGHMLLNTAAMKAGHEEIERAVNLYRALGDRPHLGSALAELAFALLLLGRIGRAELAITEALILLEPAGWPRTLAVAYSIQSCIEATLGRFDAARAAGEKSARLCSMAGADRISLVVAANLVQMLLEKGDIDGAIAAGRDMMVQLRDTPHSDLRGFVQGVLAAAHTARGDVNEALTVAREAAPLLRDDGALFWLFDHLALRAALAGRARDAALIAGYADAVHDKSDHPREPMGRRAVERTIPTLRETLGEPEFAALARVGAQLSEDQVLTLALGS